MNDSDDRAVIEAFVGGAPTATGPNLHVERDILYREGWWHVALRLDGDTFLVRDEPAPDGTPTAPEVCEALRERGLVEVPGEHPLLQVVTYTELAVVSQQWQLWALDRERGEAVLAARAAAESTPMVWDPTTEPDPSS